MILERVARMQHVTDRHGVPLAAAAMQFPLLEPAVASVLVGTGKPSSLERNLDLPRLPVPPPAWSEPEAFAIGRNWGDA